MWSLAEIKAAAAEALADTHTAGFAAAHAGPSPTERMAELIEARQAVEFSVVRHPEKWWRKDGTRPAVGESTDGLLWHDPIVRHGDGELKAVRAFRQAVESGDHSRIGELADAAQAAEQAEDRKAAANAAAQKRREAKARAQSDEINALIEQGWDETEAEAKVTGKTAESIRIRNFIRQQRRDGSDGREFTELLTDAHLAEVIRLEAQAEEATHGYMLKPKYQDKMDPGALWMIDNDAAAREFMSEEMAAWFDQNGRLTKARMRSRIENGYTRSEKTEDYLQ